MQQKVNRVHQRIENVFKAIPQKPHVSPPVYANHALAHARELKVYEEKMSEIDDVFIEAILDNLFYFIMSKLVPNIKGKRLENFKNCFNPFKSLYNELGEWYWFVSVLINPYCKIQEVKFKKSKFKPIDEKVLLKACEDFMKSLPNGFDLPEEPKFPIWKKIETSDYLLQYANELEVYEKEKSKWSAAYDVLSNKHRETRDKMKLDFIKLHSGVDNEYVIQFAQRISRVNLYSGTSESFTRLILLINSLS